MPTPLRSLVGFILSFVPVIYCGGLVYYFINSSGSLQDAENNGLGPTVFGLGIVGLLFCIPLLVKIVLIFIELRKPRLSVDGGVGWSPPSGDDKFDADVVVARYMTKRQLETDSGPPGATPGGNGGPARRSNFGRKNK